MTLQQILKWEMTRTNEIEILQNQMDTWEIILIHSAADINHTPYTDAIASSHVILFAFRNTIYHHFTLFD